MFENKKKTMLKKYLHCTFLERTKQLFGCITRDDESLRLGRLYSRRHICLLPVLIKSCQLFDGNLVLGALTLTALGVAILAGPLEGDLDNNKKNKKQAID